MKFTKTIGGNWIATVDGLTIVCEKIKTKTGWSRGRQLYRVTWKASTTIDGKCFATIHDTRTRAIQDLLEVEIGYAYLNRPTAARTINRNYVGSSVRVGTVVYSELMQVETVGHQYDGEVLIVKLNHQTGGMKYALVFDETHQMYDGCHCLRFATLSDAAAYLGV